MPSPEPWIQTPEFLHDRARRVHAARLNVNDEISRPAKAGRLSSTGSRWLAWKRTLEAWAKWYGDAGATTWLWSGTAATLDHYEQEISDWQTWLRRTYPDVATNLAPAPMQYTPLGAPKAGSWLPWAVGAGAALGLLLYWRQRWGSMTPLGVRRRNLVGGQAAR